MAKRDVSPTEPQPHDLSDLLAAMGLADADNFRTLGLETAIYEIECAWLSRHEVPNVGPYRKLLRKFRANTARRLELRKQFPPVVREAIEMAGGIRANPNVHVRIVRAVVQNNRGGDRAKAEEWEDQNIKFVIDRADDYRKRQVTKLLVEPFLSLLDEFHVVPHPKRLPLIRMMRAFFDLLGVDDKLRPSDVSIRTIARELRRRDRRD